jgi:hypothetical protein
MSCENLVELLDNVPYTSNEQELCFDAADEIERLRDELETVKAVLEELRK